MHHPFFKYNLHNKLKYKLNHMLPPTITNTLPFCYYCLINKSEQTLYVCNCGITTCSQCISSHVKHMKLFPQTHEDISFFDNFSANQELTQEQLKAIWLKKYSGKFMHNVIGEIKKNEIHFFNITDEEKFFLHKKLLSLWNNSSDCLHVTHNHVKLNLEEKLKIEGLIKLKGINLPESQITDEEMHKFTKEIKEIPKCNYACFTCISETTSQTNEINKMSDATQIPYNLYLCLSCFSVNCGRNNYVMFGKEHMKSHYEETGHEIVIQVFSGLCFCYKCNLIISIPGVGEYLESIGIYKYSSPVINKLNKKLQKTEDISNEDENKTVGEIEEHYEKIPDYKEVEKEHSKIIFDLKQHYEGVAEIEQHKLFKANDSETSNYKKTKEDLVFTPIPNYKNTCYVATTFQLLNRIFNKKYDLESHLINCRNDTYFDCLGCWILKIFKYLNTPHGSLFIDDFLNNLYVRSPQFQINRHEDASEFLNYIFCIIESFEGKDCFPFLMNSLKIHILKVSICETQIHKYCSNESQLSNKVFLNKHCKEDVSVSTDFSYSQIIGFSELISTALSKSIEPIIFDCPCGNKKIFKEFLFPSEDFLIDLKRYNYDYTNNTIEKIDTLIKPDILEFNANIFLNGEKYNLNLKKLLIEYTKREGNESTETIKVLKTLLEREVFENRGFKSRGTVLHLGTAESGHYMLMVKDKGGLILSDDKLFKCTEGLIENGYIFWYSEK